MYFNMKAVPSNASEEVQQSFVSSHTPPFICFYNYQRANHYPHNVFLILWVPLALGVPHTCVGWPAGDPALRGQPLCTPPRHPAEAVLNKFMFLFLTKWT